MKALILAAGKGTRLGGITKKLPKPMIELNGKPILEHNIEICKQAGIKEIFINLHHLPEKITKYFGDGSRFSVKITYNHEKELLGTAGALRDFKNDIGNDSFFVIYGDNYSTFNLLDLKNFNTKKNGDASILYHWRKNVASSGISEFNNDHRILKFIEKPGEKYAKEDWVNAGIYYFNNRNIFGYISKFDDFARDLFPKLIAEDYKLFGYKDKIELLAFDTPELLSRNKYNQKHNLKAIE